MKLEQLAQELDMDPEDVEEIINKVNMYTEKEGFKLEVVNDLLFFVDIETDTTKIITGTGKIKELIYEALERKEGSIREIKELWKERLID